MKDIKKFLGVGKDEIHKEVCFNRIIIYVLLLGLGFCIAYIIAKDSEVQYLNNKIDKVNNTINTRIDVLSENIDVYFNMQGITNKGEIKWPLRIIFY